MGKFMGNSWKLIETINLSMRTTPNSDQDWDGLQIRPGCSPTLCNFVRVYEFLTYAVDLLQ